MNLLKIIQKYYPVDSLVYKVFLIHSFQVTKKALEIALKVESPKPDLKFIRDASLLHDIGIFLTKNPPIGCQGDKPYITHGYLGREILEKEGLPKHALVAERHVGVGISLNDIIKYKLPLPLRDMLPLTTEEKIITFADKFFSKSDNLKILSKINNNQIANLIKAIENIFISGNYQKIINSEIKILKNKEESKEKIKESFKKYGQDKVKRFELWTESFF